MLLLFTGILIALVFFGAQLKVPTAFAFPGGAGTFVPATPTANTCAANGCHTGTNSSSGAVITFPSGMTSYTPGGAAIPITITVPGTSFQTWGFQVTARLASNLASAGGFFSTGDNGTAQRSGSSSTFTLSWTPPPSGTTGGVNFYLSGVNTNSFSSSNLFSTGMFTLSPAASGVTPAITSANNTTFTVGTAGTFTVTATGTPAPTRGETGALPAGVTFNATTGVLSGTPTVSGPFPITFTATNGTSPNASQSFTLTVNPAPIVNHAPAITSASSTTFTVGTAGMFTMTATGTPAPTRGETGALPAGVTFNATTGVLSGTPTVSGPFPITFTAQNGTAPNATQNFTLTVNPATTVNHAPVITSASSTTFTVGTAGTFMMTATGTPAPTLGETGALPAGVTFSTTTGVLSGTPTVSGPFPITFTAQNGIALNATQNFTLTVNPATTGAGALTASPTSLTFNYQMGGRSPASRTLAVTSTGGSISYTATETDPWLSINPTSGTSTPGAPGSIRASVNPAGMAPGSYGAQINISTQNGKTTTVSVALIITSGSGGGGGTPSGMNAQAYVSDTQSGALAAAWVDNLGTSPHNTSDPLNRGLVLAKSASAPVTALAGATIQNVTGISLTELGFDFRAGITCSTDSPHFVVVTTDGVTHTVGGCSSSAAAGQTTAPMGWMRLRFNPSQATPPIQAADQVQSISVVLDKGANQPGSSPTQNATGSIVVIDNITINGTIVGKGPSTTPTPTPQPPPSEGHRDD